MFESLGFASDSKSNASLRSYDSLAPIFNLNFKVQSELEDSQNEVAKLCCFLNTVLLCIVNL